MPRTRRTEALVEHQARWRQLKELAGIADAEATERLRHEGPFVTVSRQLASGGAQLAARIAAPLGWRVVDRELIAAIVHAGEGSESALSLRDEHAAGLFDDYVSHLLVPDDPGQAGYLRAMARAVIAFAHEGRVVILGRGANWLLRSACGLRVRAVADLEARVERLLAREHDLTAHEARTKLLHHDAEQRRFIRQTFGRDIEDPTGYDVVVNLGTVTIEDAARLIVSAVGQRIGSPCGAADRS